MVYHSFLIIHQRFPTSSKIRPVHKPALVHLNANSVDRPAPKPAHVHQNANSVDRPPKPASPSCASRHSPALKDAGASVFIVCHDPWHANISLKKSSCELTFCDVVKMEIEMFDSVTMHASPDDIALEREPQTVQLPEDPPGHRHAHHPRLISQALYSTILSCKFSGRRSL